MFEIAVTNAVLASLLALIVAMVLRFCGKPALSHALWILVLIKLVVLPVVDLPIPRGVQTWHHATLDWAIEPGPSDLDTASNKENKGRALADDAAPAAAATPASANLSVESGVVSRKIEAPFRTVSWKSILVGFWLFGSAIFTAMAIIEIVRFRRATRFSRPIDRRLSQVAKEVATQLEMTAPKIRLVSETISPVVWCLFSRPTVYVPERLLADLDDRQAATLLAHEFAHIKRRDYVIRWLELATTVAYWWLPVVWLARHRLRAAEEQLCDAMVVQYFPNKTSSYVSTLLQTVEFLIDSQTREPMLASNMGNFQILKRRCEMIMGKTFEKLSNSNRALLWTLAIAILPIAITLPAPDVVQAQTRRASSTSAPGAGAAELSVAGSPRAQVAGGDATSVSEFSVSANAPGADDAFATANERAASSPSLDPDAKFELGDLRMQLRDLLALKGFEMKRDTHRGGDPFGADDLADFSTEPKTRKGSKSPRYMEFSRATKAFSEIYYYDRPQKSNYFRFQVREKFDQAAAVTQLNRQLKKNFGSSRGTRNVELDGSLLSISFEVDQRNPASPAVVIELREIPDWSAETEDEKRDREESRAASNDLFG